MIFHFMWPLLFSTFDLHSNLDAIVIEERSPDEVLKIGGKRIAPESVKVLNPAFDLTPPNLVVG